VEITLEKQSDSKATLKVHLLTADYEPQIKEKLKDYSKKVTLKGFRPGKVPASMVQKMYGKSVKVDEINNLVIKSIQDYIQQNKLHIIGYPLPAVDSGKNLDWDSPVDYNFDYEIGLVPTFSYSLSDKVKVEEYDITLSEESVKTTLDNLRKQYGQMTDATEVKDTDFVSGELNEVNGSFTTNTLVPANRLNKKGLAIFENKKVGDVVSFNIEDLFDDASHLAHLTGRPKEDVDQIKGAYTYTIGGIRRSSEAPLNQEFFDKIFGEGKVSTEEEFMAKLKETISENYKRESDAALARNIKDTFVKATAITLSEDFLKRWLLVSNEGKVTADQVEKEYDAFAQELKWSLIKSKVGEDNQIKVEHEEIVQQAKNMIMSQFGMSSISEEMQETIDKVAENYLQHENGKNYQSLYEQAYNDKVLAFIKEKVSISKKKVTSDEFQKIVSA
jgi:trigger factor